MLTLTRREVVRQAGPMILANAVVPLAGVVDTAVIGAVGGSSDLGGIALGATLFNLLYTTFYFLRMGTSGLAAQSEGAGDRAELQRVLVRALAVAVVAGVAMVLASPLLSATGLAIFQGGQAVESAGSAYFQTRVLGAPCTLISFAITGWLIGRGRAEMVLGMSVVASLTNVVLDLLLVSVFGMGVSGIGYATAAADTAGAVVGLALVARIIHIEGGLLPETIHRSALLAAGKMAQLLSLNTDMMIRSWGLLAGFAWFVNAGASQGDAILAGNHVLIQVITVWSFVLDAFAFTAETGVGRAFGQRSRPALRHAIRLTSELALLFGLCAAALTLLAGPQLLAIWIADTETLASAQRYLPYCALVPLLGVPAWQLDGIFIGATRSAAMRNASVVSLVLYVLLDWALRPLGVDGMWAAFLGYYLCRAVTLGWAYPALEVSLSAQDDRRGGP